MRLLDRQASVLNELRVRASIVLSASGIVASVLGSQALRRPHPLPLAIMALVALTVGLLLCIAVLWRVRDTGQDRAWKVTLSNSDLDPLAGMNEAAGLNYIVDTFLDPRERNFDTIKQRTTWFSAACIALVFQIILWAFLLLWPAL